MTTIAHKLRAIAQNHRIHAVHIKEGNPAHDYMHAVAPILMQLADELDPSGPQAKMREQISLRLDVILAEATNDNARRRS